MDNQTTPAAPVPASPAKKGGFFKKLLLIIFGVFILLVIIGIAGSGSPEKSSDQQTETKSEASNETAIHAVGDNVQVDEVRWKLVEAKDLGSTLKGSASKYPSISTDKTSVSGKYIQVIVEVENLGKEMKSVTNLKIIDGQDREFSSASDVSEWIPEGKELYILSNLNPNVMQQFVDIFEVASDATNMKLKVGDLKIFGNQEALISLGF